MQLFSGLHVAKRARQRGVTLRFDTFEERVVPALGLGVNIPSYGNSAAVAPPIGNSGAVGPNHYVQFEIGRIVVYDKAGNEIENSADTSFWEAAGINNTEFITGLALPRIAYDELTDRWFAIEINLNPTNNQVFVARSDGADPTGPWKAVKYTGIVGQFANFPTLGLDADGVYIGSANFENRDSPVNKGVTLTSIPKADLLQATPSLSRATTLTQAGPSAMGWAPQVVTNFDPNPDNASIISTHYVQFDRIVRTSITGADAANATFGTSSILMTQTTSLPAKSRQPAPPANFRILSAGDDDRYASTIYQVGDLIYAAHPISVNASGVAVNPILNPSSTNAVHLVVISDSLNTIVAQGTYFNSAYDYSYASVAVNEYGDIVMGLNRSGFNVTNGYVGAYAVYARINPGTSTITFGPEIQLSRASPPMSELARLSRRGGRTVPRTSTRPTHWRSGRRK